MFDSSAVSLVRSSQEAVLRGPGTGCITREIFWPFTRHKVARAKHFKSTQLALSNCIELRSDCSSTLRVGAELCIRRVFDVLISCKTLERWHVDLDKCNGTIHVTISIDHHATIDTIHKLGRPK